MNKYFCPLPIVDEILARKSVARIYDISMFFAYYQTCIWLRTMIYFNCYYFLKGQFSLEHFIHLFSTFCLRNKVIDYFFHSFNVLWFTEFCMWSVGFPLYLMPYELLIVVWIIFSTQTDNVKLFVILDLFKKHVLLRNPKPSLCSANIWVFLERKNSCTTGGSRHKII